MHTKEEVTRYSTYGVMGNSNASEKPMEPKGIILSITGSIIRNKWTVLLISNVPKRKLRWNYKRMC